MRNIELKARVDDLKARERIARKIGAKFQWQRKQIDTYFGTKFGRLKLREVEDEEAQLIGYFRSDDPEFRESRYSIVAIPDPEKMRNLLSETLGVVIVVEKIRTLFLYKNIRVHLDRVTDLGDFLELEGVLATTAQEAETRKELDFLMKKFRINPEQTIAYSYSDLLLNKQMKQ